MGLAFGYLVGPNSAPAVLNLAWLPMAFASGLWIPISQLPDFVRSIAGACRLIISCSWPLARSGRPKVDRRSCMPGRMLAFTAGFLAVAAWGFRRDEGRTYG